MAYEIASPFTFVASELVVVSSLLSSFGAVALTSGGSFAYSAMSARSCQALVRRSLSSHSAWLT